MAAKELSTEDVRQGFASAEPTGGATADGYERGLESFDHWLATFKAEVRAEAFAEGARLLDAAVKGQDRSTAWRDGYTEGLQDAATKIHRLASSESYPSL